MNRQTVVLDCDGVLADFDLHASGVLEVRSTTQKRS